MILVFGKLDGDARKYTGNLVGVVAIVWAGWLVLKYLQWTMTYFVVTSRRVIYRTGVLSKKGVEIPLERINNINFHQRIIDRIIGAGDLDIESAGPGRSDPFRLHPPSRRRAARGVPPDGARNMPTYARASRGCAGSARRRPGADRTARQVARRGPHQRGGVRNEEGRAPQPDVAPFAARATNVADTRPVAMR